MGALIAASEAVGTERNKPPRHIGRDHIWDGTDVIRGYDDRKVTLQQCLDMALGHSLVRMTAFLSCRFLRVPRKFGEAGGTENVRCNSKFSVQNVSGSDNFLQDRARSYQANPSVFLVFTPACKSIQPLENIFLYTFRHGRHRVIFVHYREVVELVDLVFHHPATTVIDNDGQFINISRVVAATVGNGCRYQLAGAILMLEAFTRQRGPASGGTNQESSGTLIGGSPDQITNPLKTKH